MYKEQLNKMQWSFSSVNSFTNCPYCFYLTYIERKPRVQNAFAEWGSFGHSLLEKYFKGELDFFELSQAYVAGYDAAVTEQFPPNKYVDLSQKYFEAGKAYFDTFEGLSDSYEILSVEEKIQMPIGGFPFVGYADLIIRDKNDDDIIVVDHKSKSGFKSALELEAYLRQLYLYGIYVKEHFGKHPKELWFNMFRTGDIVKHPFSVTESEHAVQWFVDTIQKIYNCITFPDKIQLDFEKKKKSIAKFNRDDFFCNYLCGVREHCDKSNYCQGGDAHCS